MDDNVRWRWYTPDVIRGMVRDLAEREMRHRIAAARILASLAGRCSDNRRRQNLALLAEHFRRRAERAAARIHRMTLPEESALDCLWRFALVQLGPTIALQWIAWQERMDLRYKRHIIEVALRLGRPVQLVRCELGQPSERDSRPPAN
jgi:hypothetical protein